MAADAGAVIDQDRHVMSRNHVQSRSAADPTCWSRTGNASGRPENFDYRRDKPHNTLEAGLNRRSPRSDPPLQPQSTSARGSQLPAFDASAIIKSP
jgi:hypothetical protein